MLPSEDQWHFPIPFGVCADTGQLLAGLEEAAFDEFRQREERGWAGSEQRALQAKRARLAPSVAEVDDPNNLQETGWAVLFSPSAGPLIEEALEPLLKLRCCQANDLYRVFKGEYGFLAGDGDVYGWLNRHQVSLDQPVNPRRGIPYYLLIVAPPDEIPFNFQYALDIQWAVGRIWFPNVSEFRRYAESVVRYESASAVPTSRQVAVFAPEHEFDRATQLFAKHVAKPLVDPADPIGRRAKFGIQKLLGSDATRENLHGVWSGTIENGSPAMVFTGSHGMAFPSGDAGQELLQGAILCQDWEGFGKIRREHYYAAADLPAAAKVHGLVHFFFACYGAGWPHLDNFSRMGKPAAVIAPKPMLARLPQALLSHPEGGSLAVVGHVDRAWAYSFKSGSFAQIDSFRDVSARILRGDRMGNAMDQFNQRWATLSERLAELLDQWTFPEEKMGRFETQMAKRISTHWVARDDARNYIVFGDPAVRLRVNEMPPLAPSPNLTGTT
jgi:hypothetical protein